MVMDRDEILARVCVVLSDIADDMNHVAIKPSAQLERDLGLDSFDRVDLLNQVEDEFSGIRFPHPLDRELSRPESTVADIVTAVSNLLAMKAPA